MFNIIIKSLDRQEIELSGRKFTWENTVPNPTFEKLARILTSVEWEHKYSLVTSRAMMRAISDIPRCSFTLGKQRMEVTRTSSPSSYHG